MAAPYIATIAFTGICYLVNAGSGGGINKVSVVMPNGEAGLTVSGGAVVPPHYGFILYLKSQAVPQTTPEPTVRDADLTFTDSHGNVFGVIKLKGEKLSFDNTDSVLEIASAAGTTGGPSCIATTCNIVDPPAAFDKTLFIERLPYSKIVSRKVACPRCTDIPPSSLYLNPTTTSDVIARVDLTGGYLASAAVKECLWDFLPQEQCDAPPGGQQLPQIAAIDVKTQGTSNSLSILSTRFDGGNTKLPLKLQGTDTSRIVVVIGNAPLSDITAFGGHPSNEIEDHHFELYYKLLSSSLTGHPHPKVILNSGPGCGQVFFHLGNCPPMQQQ